MPVDPERKEALVKAKKLWEEKANDEKAKKHMVTGHTGGEVRLGASELQDTPVLHLQNNKNTRFVIESVRIIKLLVEGCDGCTITTSQCTMLSGTCEIWSCKSVSYSNDKHVGTLQIDMCSEVQVLLREPAHLGQLVQAGVDTVKLTFEEAAAHSKEISMAELVGEHTDITPDDKTTQFITRVVEGNLLTERLVRLVNDYPTTMRENTKFIEDTQATEEKVAELTMGLTGKLSAEEEAKVAEMAKQISGSADATSAERRAEVKREKGTAEFKGGNVPQAVVHYTEAILIQPDAKTYANRAACFLRMFQFDKALIDADACLKLDDKYVKAHFRRGLALLELNRLQEAGQALSRTLELDPNNKQAKSSLAMCQMKLAKSRK